MCTRCEDAYEYSGWFEPAVDVVCLDRVFDCPDCHAAGSVTVAPESAHPESPDIASCDECSWEETW